MAALGLGYLALAVAMTFPLAAHLHDAVPGPPWDNLVWLYDLWWTQRTWLQGQGSPLFNPGLFAPWGYDLTLSETMPANKLLALPFLAAAGPVVAYNALVLLSYALSGLGMYLLVRELTGSRAAGWVSGLIFALAPYRMHALAAGWLPLLATQWVPLAFWALERGLRRGRWGWFALSGAMLAACALSSWYYLFVVWPFVLGYGVWRAVRLGARTAWAGVALALVVAGLLVLPAALPVLRSSAGGMGWPLTEVEKWSIGLDDFFLPGIYHPLWGRAVLGLRPQVPGYPWYAPGFVSLGLVPLVLAALGLWRRPWRPGMGAYLACGLISLVLALGTSLHWGGARVYIPVPEAVERIVARTMHVLFERLALNRASYGPLQRPGAVPVLLPGALLYLFVPLGDALRTMYRFGLMTITAVAVLAGYGVAAWLPQACRQAEGKLWRRNQVVSRHALGGLLLSALVCFEFAVAPLGFGYTRLPEQPLDRWLAAQPAGSRVMQFPLVRALNGSSLYRTIAHGQPVCYGHGTFYPAAFQAAGPVLNRFPSAETLDLLRAWGVRYVVVGQGAYEAGWGDLPGQTWEQVRAHIDSSRRLRRVYETDELPVWEGERVSDLLRGNLPVQPIVSDHVLVYELGD